MVQRAGARLRSVMRTFLRISIAVSALGVLLFITGIVFGVAAGGVPYHDGPNAGHVSPPGFSRWLEEISLPLVLSGMFAAVLGIISLIGSSIVLRLATTRKSLMICNPKRNGQS